MNKRVKLDNLGGFPFTQDTLKFMQESYRDAFKAIAALLGEKVIVTGVVNVAGVLSNGWITYQGELIPFVGGAATAGVVIQETATSEVYEDLVNKEVYFTKVAFCGAPATFPFADLKPLDTISGLNDAIADLVDGLANHVHAWSTITNNPFKEFGSVDIGNIPTSDGYYTIALATAQPDNNYKVIGTLRGKNSNLDLDNDVSFAVGKFTTTQFELAVREYAAAAQNLAFDYIIIRP